MTKFVSSCLIESKERMDRLLIDLPLELIDKIISYMSYHKISEIRRVCRTFDSVCRRLLNQGFMKADRLHCAISRRLKSQLPRRESERRNHALARHIDILSSVETRLSLMNMTYMKYIDSGTCCFIPGKVLDEVFNILHCINTCKELPRAHEFLLELRDISSMAMEHFDEKILPSFKTSAVSSLELSSAINSINNVSTCTSVWSSPTSSPVHPVARSPQSPIVQPVFLTQETMRLLYQVKVNRAKQTVCMAELRQCKTLITEQTKKLKDQERKIHEHQAIIARQSQQLLDLDKKVLLNVEKIMDVGKRLSVGTHLDSSSHTTSDACQPYTRVLRSSTLISSECSKALAGANKTSDKNNARGRKRSQTVLMEGPNTKKKR